MYHVCNYIQVSSIAQYVAHLRPHRAPSPPAFAISKSRGRCTELLGAMCLGIECKRLQFRLFEAARHNSFSFFFSTLTPPVFVRIYPVYRAGNFPTLFGGAQLLLEPGVRTMWGGSTLVIFRRGSLLIPL